VVVDDDVLIHTWSAGLTLSPDIAVHNVAIDVTGGIGFKLMNASLVTLKTRGEIKVTLINGGVMNRFIRAITGRPVRGTEVVHIS
jgi:isopentenyl phosphate kinase